MDIEEYKKKIQSQTRQNVWREELKNLFVKFSILKKKNANGMPKNFCCRKIRTIHR